MRFKSEGNAWYKGFPEEQISFLAGDGETPPGWQESYYQGTAISPDDLVVLGISCESCHFGGREHAQNGKPIRFVDCDLAPWRYQ